MSLSTARTSARPLPLSHIGSHFVKHISPSRCHLIKNNVLSFRSQRFIVRTSQAQHTLVLKGNEIGFHPLQSRRTIRRPSALNVSCGVAETQTLTRKSASATIVSPPGKETLPMLDDDGGSGFRGNGYTPYYRGDGSGGGSGGAGGGLPSSGEFPWGDYWLYIFLFLLRFLIMNMIGEGSCLYKYEDGRNKPIRRYV